LGVRLSDFAKAEQAARRFRVTEEMPSERLRNCRQKRHQLVTAMARVSGYRGEITVLDSLCIRLASQERLRQRAVDVRSPVLTENFLFGFV